MKKLLLIIGLLVFAIAGFSQLKRNVPVLPAGAEPGDGIVAMTKGNGGTTNTDVLYSYVLPFNGGTSGNTRCPGNTFRYQRTIYLITPAEMAASGYPAGQTVDGIGFLIYAAGGTSQTGAFKMYLMNTTHTSYSISTDWTTAIAGFTLVNNVASWTVPIALGPYSINFSGGSTFTYTGGGVYVAFEFTNPVPGILGTGALTASCNYTAGINYLYGSRSNTGFIALTGAQWRPATTFINNSLTDIFSVTNIYTYEKCPVPYGAPNKISVRVQNVDASENTVDVTVSVNSNPPYSATISGIELSGNSSAIVDFNGWNPSTTENVTITATASAGPGENFLTNNTKSIPAQVNSNLFSYFFSPTLDGAYGYGTGSVIWASKYHMSGSGVVSGVNIGIFDNGGATTSIGKTVHAVVLNSAGVIVGQSDDVLLTAGNVNQVINFPVNTDPGFTNEDFYVGLWQPESTAAWYPMAYMNEEPQRAGTFFIFDPTGGTPAPAPTGVKWLLEAQVAPTIPTLTEWGLIILGLALLGIGTIYLLRRS